MGRSEFGPLRRDRLSMVEKMHFRFTTYCRLNRPDSAKDKCLPDLMKRLSALKVAHITMCMSSRVMIWSKMHAHTNEELFCGAASRCGLFESALPQLERATCVVLELVELTSHNPGWQVSGRPELAEWIRRKLLRLDGETGDDWWLSCLCQECFLDSKGRWACRECYAKWANERRGSELEDLPATPDLPSECDCCDFPSDADEDSEE